MEKTYQILLTLNVPTNVKGDVDHNPVKETIYTYLKDLIEDDSLYFEEMEND
jgi:hypothetical protein